MGYRLGVDVGTTFTAAAVDDGSGPRMVGLGNRALQVPSVLFLQDDGTFLFGEAAERRGTVEPARVVREFKRRFGDTVPILVDGQPFSPQALTARLLSFVIAAVTEREGAPPEEVVVTHPANWGGFKRELMDQVIRLANVSSALTCTEPEAAAIQYASRAGLAEDAKVAVYDLGGGTFDICVLAKQPNGFRILGAPEGVEHLGGIDFDEAVFQHVLHGPGEQVARLDLDDPQVTTALTRLRRDCVEAKEALSNDVDTAIPVTLPGLNTTVRLTRTELESLITPALRDTLAATHRALRSAQTSPDQLAAIVLVGGSSRIPLVSHLLNSEFAVPTALDTHPKHDIALGAVQHRPSTSDQAAPLPAATVEKWPTRQAATVPPPPSAPSEPDPDLLAAGAAPGSATATSTRAIADVEAGLDSTHRRSIGYGAVAGLLAVGAVVAAFTLPPSPAKTSDWDRKAESVQLRDVPGAATQVRLLLTAGIENGNGWHKLEDGVEDGNREFTITNADKLFLTGPVGLQFGDAGGVPLASTKENEGGFLIAEGGGWWKPFLTVPGAVLVIGLLYAFAYAETMLRSVRLGSGQVRVGQLVGLTGVGLILGAVATLGGWAAGNVLDLTTLGVAMVLMAVAGGLTAFGVAAAIDARSPR